MSVAMSRRAPQQGPGRPPGRIGRALGYDGIIAALLLGAFGWFRVSVSFLVALIPLVVFQALVGWQLTHLALWLGAAALLPAYPALEALLTAGAVLLDGGPRPGRAFWVALGRSVRRRWWAAIVPSAAALLLGYDLAVLGAGALALLAGAVASALVFVLAIGLACRSSADEDRQALALVADAVRRIAVRPHIPLTWLLLAAVIVLASSLPVLGALGWMFGPAAFAVTVQICNRGLGFDGHQARMAEGA
ncbi:MAG: hypothetical protein JST33_14770 [Actinobacteria bacterium]|nr:hypothetical protein [Actinomycetota bacterium]